MQKKDLYSTIKKYSPDNYQDISDLLCVLSKQLDRAKESLTSAMIIAQNENDYDAAREILDAQEQIMRKISEINDILINVEEEKDITTLNKTKESKDKEKINKSEKEKTEKINKVEKTRTKTYSKKVSTKNMAPLNEDEMVAYKLDDAKVEFTHPSAFSIDGKMYIANTWREFLHTLCNILYKENPQVMIKIADIRSRGGKGKPKMSYVKEEHNSPKLIENSDIWLETNLSAVETRKSIIELLNKYEISLDRVKVFFMKE